MHMLQILELFGGIGSQRVVLRNLHVVKVGGKNGLD